MIKNIGGGGKGGKGASIGEGRWCKDFTERNAQTKGGGERL